MRVLFHIGQGLFLGLALLGALWITFYLIVLDGSSHQDDIYLSLNLVVFAVVGVGLSPNLWLSPRQSSPPSSPPPHATPGFPSAPPMHAPTGQTPGHGPPQPGQTPPPPAVGPFT